jgi:hypothetical protein
MPNKYYYMGLLNQIPIVEHSQMSLLEYQLRISVSIDALPIKPNAYMYSIPWPNLHNMHIPYFCVKCIVYTLM